LEHYRDKIIEQIKNSEKELDNTEGIRLFKAAQIQDKAVVFDVYEKLLKDSDNAYSKVLFSNIRLLTVPINYIKW
jgi:transcriptional regulator